MYEKIIEANTRWWRQDFPELYRHRELLWTFVMRQFLVRYKQTALGILWAVLEPLLQLTIISVVFGLILKADSNGFPYPIYAFAGLGPWTIFTRCLLNVAGSLQENMPVISKVYFPRIILPLSVAIREGLDALIVLSMLIVVSALFGYTPTLRLLMLPVLLAGVLACGFIFGLPLTCVLVKFRDVRQAMPFVLQVWMYCTPILYSLQLIPERLQFLVQLNPMYWVISGFRWMFLGQTFTPEPLLYACLGGMAVLLAFGWLSFAYFERRTIDVQ